MKNAVERSPRSEVHVPMLSLSLGQIIHQERQREIERTLENRRLLAQLREGPERLAPANPARVPQRQERAGAAS